MYADKVRFFRFFTIYSFAATCLVWFASYLFGGLPPEQQASFGWVVPQVLSWIPGASLILNVFSMICFVTLRSLVRPLSATVERFAEDERTNKVIEELRANLTFHRFRYRNAKHDLERLRHERKIADLQERINAERRKLGIQIEARSFEELH